MGQEKTRKELEKELIYFKKVNESLGQGIRTLEGEIVALKTINEMLINEKKQWVTQKIIQERIIQDTINKSNSINQEYQEEIQRLKEEVKNNNHNNVVIHSED